MERSFVRLQKFCDDEIGDASEDIIQTSDKRQGCQKYTLQLAGCISTEMYFCCRGWAAWKYKQVMTTSAPLEIFSWKYFVEIFSLKYFPRNTITQPLLRNSPWIPCDTSHNSYEFVGLKGFHHFATFWILYCVCQRRVRKCKQLVALSWQSPPSLLLLGSCPPYPHLATLPTLPPAPCPPCPHLPTFPTPCYLAHTFPPCPPFPHLAHIASYFYISLITPQFSQAPSPAIQPPHTNFDHWTLTICPTNSCCLVHVRLSQEICHKLGGKGVCAI